MKTTRFLPVFAVIISMLFLSACSTAGLASVAPAAGITSLFNNPVSANAPVTSAPLVNAPLASAPLATNPQTTAGVDALQNAYEAVYQSVNPSVVTIVISSPVSASGRSNGFGFGQPGNGNGQSGQGQVVPTAEGSGFIWDTSGHIVTNNHVVSGASQIEVTFSDGSSYPATVVGTDPNSDLAVIQVTNAPAALLKPIKIGDSTQVKVGEMVVAIGNPFGLNNTMTTGIVSAIGRSIPATASSNQNGLGNTPTFSIPDVIQTDAAINPGNSGGVLVDMTGALIGVPSQIESASGSNSGVGFAIPSAIVNKVAPQLISTGKAGHSYLGISGATLTPDVISALNLPAGQQGVLVATVLQGGPAGSAGLQGATVDANGTPTAAGDIITGINGQPITRMEALISYLANNTEPGQSVTLTVLRNGQTIQVPVTLGTQPTN